MTSYDIKSRKPVVAAKSPIGVDVEAGKDYYWCTCGMSKNQPFCDGSHKALGEDAGPLKYTAAESKKVYFCACKQTSKAPMCDGTHKALPESVKPGDHWDAKKGDISLTYFDIYGVAELARVVMAAAKVPFEDRRYPVGEWAGDLAKVATGNITTSWADDKESMPFGKLPVLEFKGVKIAESNAIVRFLARRFNLMGDNDVEAALIDAVRVPQRRRAADAAVQACETMRDVNTAYQKHYNEPKDAQQAFKDKFAAEIGTHLKYVERAIKDNGTGFVVGNRLSLADLTLWRLCGAIGVADKVSEPISGVCAKVEADEGVKAHLAARPQRPF